MRLLQWQDRFLSSSRGRVIMLLRGRSRTVNELSDGLHLTDNTVRSHLATLMREGYVQEVGLRKGVRRPHREYALTAAAERLFTRACDPVLEALLTALTESLPAGTLIVRLGDAGRRMADAYRTRSAGQLPQGPAQAAAQALSELGAVAEVIETDGRPYVSALRCPLADSIPEHPQLCLMIESYLTRIAGAPMQTRCHRVPEPRCLFAILPVAPASA